MQRDRPWIALLCVGAVAAQVPVFAVFLPLTVMTTVLTSRTIRADRSLWFGLAGGVAIAVLPSLHYLHRFGTLTLLAGASRPHWPARGELGIALWDLNLGLVPNWPPIAFAAGAAIIVARKRVHVAGDHDGRRRPGASSRSRRPATAARRHACVLEVRDLVDTADDSDSGSGHGSSRLASEHRAAGHDPVPYCSFAIVHR